MDAAEAFLAGYLSALANVTREGAAAWVGYAAQAAAIRVAVKRARRRFVTASEGYDPGEQYRDYERPVMVIGKDGPQTGKVWARYTSGTGNPVFEVQFDGQDFPKRVASHETVVFLDTGETVEAPNP